MQWRYATSKFDTSKKLTKEQVTMLLDAVVLSPSSLGAHPWKVLVVTNEDIRKKLQEAGYNQPKIVEASHLFIFTVRKNIDDELADKYIKEVSKIRNVPVEELKSFEDMIKGGFSRRTPEARIEWGTRQAYIALGVLIAAAATLGIDVGPMEGFDPNKFDEILGLDKLGLETKVIAAVGFRANDDPRATLKKVRFPMEEMVINVE